MFPTSTLSLNGFSACFPLPALTPMQLACASAPFRDPWSVSALRFRSLDHGSKQPVYSCSPYAKEQFIRDFSVFCEEAILLCGMCLD